MTESYGQMWTNGQGDEPNNTWSIALSALKPEQIATGLERMRDNGKPFPPTLPEFMGWCRGYEDGVTARDKEAHKLWQPEKRIEDIGVKERNQTIGTATLAEMKELFQ